MKVITGSNAISLYDDRGFQFYYQAPYTVSDCHLLGTAEIIRPIIAGRKPTEVGFVTESSYEAEQMKNLKIDEHYLYETWEEAADVIHKDYREGEARRQEELNLEHEKNQALLEIGPLREKCAAQTKRIEELYVRISELEAKQTPTSEREQELENALREATETIQNMKDTFNGICKQFRIGRNARGEFVQY